MHELFLLLMCPAYALTTDPNFSVTGCNDADNIPEMTLRIKKQYFVDNLSWQTGFTLTDDDTDYEKKIPEDQLLIDLSDQCKFFDQLWTGIQSMVPVHSRIWIILGSSEHIWVRILVLLLNFYLNTTQSRRKRETEVVVYDDISLNNKPQLQFTCKYARDIDVNSQLTLSSTSTQLEEDVASSGILDYTATVKDVKIGRDQFTEVLIEPKHHLSNIYVM